MAIRGAPSAVLGAALVASLAAGCATTGGAPIKSGTVIAVRNELGVESIIRVDKVEHDPMDADGDVFLYTVSVRDPVSGAWTDFCMPDREGKRYAIPLSGYWNDRGDHVDQDEVITFACTNGVIGKCVRWGYKPWKTRNGVSLERYHQACTRMARADYCGDGQGHTRDGTLIDLYDLLGVQRKEHAQQVEFEAAWSPEGATWVRRTRYAQTLESLVAECPEKLRGHTQLDLPDLDEDAIRRRFPETLIFNGSRVTEEHQ